ncbi:MAG: amidohydrolase family protein [Planctomycetes bacterium]|nr:amidohydrolase family protein [Planctomycetota bacterium]
MRSRLRLTRAWIAALALAGLAVAGARAATPGELIAYRAAAIHTGGVPELLENAYLVVRDGKIVDIAAQAPAGARIIDLGAAVIVPGLVAADSSISSPDGEIPNAAGDLRTAGADLRAIDGFDFFASREELLAAGITTVYVAPGRGRLIGGRGAVVKLAGASRDARILRAESDLYVNVSAEALNPPGIFDPPVPPTADDPLLPEEAQAPRSTPGISLALRRLIAEAQSYRAARQKPAAERPPYDATLEAVLALGATDVRLVGRSAAEIARAIAVQREFFGSESGRRVALSGAVESAQMLERLASAGLPVILEVESYLGRFAGDLQDRPGELRHDARSAARLDEKGIRFALVPSRETRLDQLRQLAALAQAGGLSEARALQSITSSAAHILGVGERVGSLSSGRDADFAVLSAAPFALGSQVLATYVDGERAWTRADRGPKVADAFVLRAGRILDGRGTTFVDAELLVVDGRIAEVGARVARPVGCRVIDYGPNATLTPGFIDARSRFGFAENEGGTFGPEDEVVKLRELRPPGAYELALSGVTTLISSPPKASPKGTPMFAVKPLSSESAQDDAVVRELVGLRFDVKGENRQRALESLASLLKRGKAYHEAWTQYEAAYAKWKTESAAQPPAPAAAPAPEKAEEKKAAPKAEEKKPEEKKADEKKDEGKKEDGDDAKAKPDLLSGTWEGVAEKVPGYGTVPFSMTIEYDGSEARGIIRPQVALLAPILFEKGRFDGKTLTVSFQFENIHIDLSAEIANEEMKGVAKGPSGNEALLTAKRTERPEARVRSVYRPRAEVKTAEVEEKGAPKKPKLEPELECFRRAYRGELAIAVEAERRDEIEAVIRLVRVEHQLGLVLLEPREYGFAREAIEAHRPDVLLHRLIVGTADGELRVPSAELARAGVRIGFQSASSTGGRTLREVVAWAVQHGLSPQDALAAVSSWPADMYHVGDRVGSLRRGCDADILVFAGEPFALGTELRTVYLRGRQVEKVEKRWQ